jgi:hypothetical protein
MKAFFTTSLAGAVEVDCAKISDGLTSGASKQSVLENQALGVIGHY